MPRRVPILGQDDDRELGHQGVDARHDAVAVGHGKRAAGAEIGLDVDDEERVGGVVHPGPPGCVEKSRLP